MFKLNGLFARVFVKSSGCKLAIAFVRPVTCDCANALVDRAVSTSVFVYVFDCGAFSAKAVSTSVFV